MQKPTSLTVIGVIIVIFGALGLIGMGNLFLLKDNPDFQAALEAAPLPLEAQIALGLVSSVLTLVAGVGILTGKNWGRWLYVTVAIAGILISVGTNPTAPGLVGAAFSAAILAIFSFFLFRAQEDAYFKRAG